MTRALLGARVRAARRPLDRAHAVADDVRPVRAAPRCPRRQRLRALIVITQPHGATLRLPSELSRPLPPAWSSAVSRMARTAAGGGSRGHAGTRRPTTTQKGLPRTAIGIRCLKRRRGVICPPDADSRVWRRPQLGDSCCSAVSGGGTVTWPTASSSSLASRRARVRVQYFGASSRYRSLGQYGRTRMMSAR